ncbi:hypothetical protein, partial [Eikenella corrodens]|uniref:hypothetical protein n=1 Tax=Eikenella corrodens TaxID=539 RepID=UPI00195F05CA
MNLPSAGCFLGFQVAFIRRWRAYRRISLCYSNILSTSSNSSMRHISLAGLFSAAVRAVYAFSARTPSIFSRGLGSKIYFKGFSRNILSSILYKSS